METTNYVLYRKLYDTHPTLFTREERKELYKLISDFLTNEQCKVSNPTAFLTKNLQIIDILLNEMSLGKAAVLSLLLIQRIKN